MERIGSGEQHFQDNNPELSVDFQRLRFLREYLRKVNEVAESTGSNPVNLIRADLDKINGGASLLREAGKEAVVSERSGQEIEKPSILRFNTRFGELVYDSTRGAAISPLTSSEIKLGKKPGLLLEMLVKNPSGIISYEEIRENIANKGMDDSYYSNVTKTTIYVLRRALGHSKDKPIIFTYDRHGVSLSDLGDVLKHQWSNVQVVDNRSKPEALVVWEHTNSDGYKITYNVNLRLVHSSLLGPDTDSVYLTEVEGRILERLLRFPNLAFKRVDFSDITDLHSFKTHVNRIRRKLGDVRDMNVSSRSNYFKLIYNLPGNGYSLSNQFAVSRIDRADRGVVKVGDTTTADILEIARKRADEITSPDLSVTDLNEVLRCFSEGRPIRDDVLNKISIAVANLRDF